MAAKTEDLLEGISAKTTKDELMSRLRDAAQRLAGHQDENAKRLQDVERRVRAKNKPGTSQTLRRVVIIGSDEECKESMAFLAEWDEFLPSVLARLHEGWKAIYEKEEAKK